MRPGTRVRTALLGCSILTVGALAAFGGVASSDTSPHHPTPEIRAQLFAKVAPLHPDGGQSPEPIGHHTTVEGPAFGPDGGLYFTDITAPAGEPKVIRLDVATKKISKVYTDDTSSYSSLQFNPANGRMYLTDLHGARIDSMRTDGTDRRTVVSGKVAGHTIAPDDIAFDRAGHMYVSDMAGTPWQPRGRILRFDRDGKNATTVADNLSAPNGISFDPTYSWLWVSEYGSGRELRLILSADGRETTDGHVGMYHGNGTARMDSNAVDASGNVYQCMYGAGKILVWNSLGDLLTTVKIPQNLPKSQLLTTNVAIKPGTTDGYLTVGGKNGGYIYRFTAAGKGIRQSNGG